MSKPNTGIAADCAMGGTAIKPQAPWTQCIMLVSSSTAGLGESHTDNPNLGDPASNWAQPESRFAIQRQLFLCRILEPTFHSNFATNKATKLYKAAWIYSHSLFTMD